MELRNVQIIVVFVIVAFCPRSLNTFWTNAITKETDPYEEYEGSSPPTTSQLVEKQGYPFQAHKLTTHDGYILELHRIQHNSTINTNTKKIPVLFIHGLFEDSSSFVSHGEENSPGFVFVNAGYDVWMHNSRGTKYSMGHEELSSATDYEYWNFCYEDIGNKDLPAEVDYILSVTNAEKVYIVGFSIGGASSTIFLAENPSYNDKVASLFLLAPSICLFRDTHEMVYNFRSIEQVLLVVLEDIKALPYSEILYETCEVACDGLFFQMCHDFAQYISEGTNSSNWENELVINKLANALSRVTLKMLRHLLQMVVRDDFLQFDYGPQINQEKYGQEYPPGYEFKNITASVMLFCAVGDMFVLCDDLQRISSRFVNVSHVTITPLEHHHQFTGGKNARLYVYGTILNQMEALESELTKPQTFSSKAEELFEEFNSVLIVSCVLGFLVILCSALSFFLILSCRKNRRAGEQEILMSRSKPYSMYN